MPHPLVTPLPESPSRSGDPDNFLTEADFYLGAQINYRTQSNNLATYLNGISINMWNWGGLFDSNPTYIPVTLVGAVPVAGESGKVFTLKMDNLLNDKELFSYDQNTAADFIDGLQALVGTMPSSDGLRPTITQISATPARSDTILVFEDKAVAYYEGFKVYNTTFRSLIDYMKVTLLDPEDWGLVSDAVTSTDDYGLIT